MEGVREQEAERKGWEMAMIWGWKVVQARRPPWRRQQKGHVEIGEVGRRKTEA